MKDIIKKQNGVFFTEIKNPFNHPEFIKWAKEIDLKNKTILEPFAGANHIISCMKELDLCTSFNSFDITPKNKQVKKLNTLKKFPLGYSVCVTNPPWLYKSRAKRLNIDFPDTHWDNLYKLSLEKMLDNCDYVAALIPASFLNNNDFMDRLKSVIVIQEKLFAETENPVTLALFVKKRSIDTNIFIDFKYIGLLSELKGKLPRKTDNNIKFNSVDGEIGLIAIDNTKERSIRFCEGRDLSKYNIRNSSRSITRISIEGVRTNNTFIELLNKNLNILRDETYDVFMTPFKGIRKDGMYRRRLDYNLAKKIISEAL